jgi:formylglycine-generating enzyme
MASAATIRAMAGVDTVTIPAGRFRMGSTRFYPEEAPVREVELGSFAIQRAPVTVGQFARFVEQTGYVTVAERRPDPADYPDADPSLLRLGGVSPDARTGPTG